MKFKTIEWKKNSVRILDQRKLPIDVRYLECRDPHSVAQAIRTLAVRGAPAIGVAAAMGIALAATKLQSQRPETFLKKMVAVCEMMRQTRPTAINLFWAIDRMRKILDRGDSLDIAEITGRLEEEARLIHEEDVATNRKIGTYGKVLIREGDGVLTHCNAGALATAGHGTALGVLYSAWAEGKRFRVFVDETRPLLQGARLTVWELIQQKIPVTLITDNMAASLMERGRINLVLVGADRIARNGDTANKIGTYSLAILASWHRVPFYVAAPLSTLDLRLPSGGGIPIEERASEEVTHICGKRITSKGVNVFNPAFDVTPHGLIEGIITEEGIIRKPFGRNLRRIGTKGSRIRGSKGSRRGAVS
jgi:methylthioribose-1-phosphate isomerase